MQKATTQPKTKLPRIQTPKEILKIWERARGIWKSKKLDPIRYLKKTRKEWEKIL
ncbi:hypothetical protein J7K42_02105 [bacterium]|nr:hypothetical protein [bacterium]